MRSESVQANQLAAQNLADIWRQNAWRQLLRCSSSFGMSEGDRRLHVTLTLTLTLTLPLPLPLALTLTLTLT